ncbi:hypothetical protein [Vandammella animalimorsus]|uniref:Uncharacterized protein n=1 Tax=Vandammella animalimorsus TaxID=2029117 RepID=A0A2A2AWP9_9BURK|nr:hypothetical protein [Vandammella animalimorsus]PAT42203.1 hypothetical protein CK621_10415 [Vandammella animalimorsus]
MHAPAFTTANAASAAQAAWLIALIGLATAWPALAQGGGEGASDAQIMAQAIREAKAYQRGASGPMGAPPPSGQPLQPALLAPVFQSAAQARNQAGVTLRFTAQAPARFAGRRLALEKATRDQCYTDAPLRPGAACHSVTPEAMDRIGQGQQWYARNQASADEQQRIYKERSAQSDAPCQEWMAALPPDFTVLHIDQPARIGQGKRLQGYPAQGRRQRRRRGLPRAGAHQSAGKARRAAAEQLLPRHLADLAQPADAHRRRLGQRLPPPIPHRHR